MILFLKNDSFPIKINQSFKCSNMRVCSSFIRASSRLVSKDVEKLVIQLTKKQIKNYV